MAVPFKVLAQRFALLLLLLAAVGLMLVGQAKTVVVDRVSAAVVDIVAPIMDVMSRPAATISQAVDSVRELASLHSENERLRRENVRLRAWQEAAMRLSTQNAALQAMLDFVPDQRATFSAARVISDSGGAFVRSMLINAGSRNGVNKGNAVLTGSGLVGRVATAGNRSARVLLITDINSRVPAVIESSRERAILAGNNSDTLRLVFLPSNTSVKPGDRVVTSGHGGVFPPGLPIGKVIAIGKGGVRVQPFARLERLEFVRTVNFPGIAKLVPSDADAGAKAKGRRN